MNDYMTALLRRFKIETANSTAMTEQVKTAEDHLREQLGKEQRRLLLRLTDLHHALHEEVQLGGFIAGYRLAEGIREELDGYPRFSVAAEDEERARKIFEEERSEWHGETQAVRWLI